MIHGVVKEVKHLRMWVFGCKIGEAFKAFKLGWRQLRFLTLPHIIGNLLGGCVCICTKEDLDRASPYKELVMAFFIFSWYVLLISILYTDLAL